MECAQSRFNWRHVATGILIPYARGRKPSSVERVVLGSRVCFCTATVTEHSVYLQKADLDFSVSLVHDFCDFFRRPSSLKHRQSTWQLCAVRESGLHYTLDVYTDATLERYGLVWVVSSHAVSCVRDMNCSFSLAAQQQALIAKHGPLTWREGTPIHSSLIVIMYSTQRG